jgi:hypothetical protein
MADEAASQPTSQALASSSLVIAAIDPTATVDDQLKCARVSKDIEGTIYTLVLLSPQTVTNVNIALTREMYPGSGDAVFWHGPLAPGKIQAFLGECNADRNWKTREISARCIRVWMR